MGKLNRGFLSLAQTHYFRSQFENARRARRDRWVLTRVAIPGAIIVCLIAAKNCKGPEQPTQDPRPAPTDTRTTTDPQSLRRVLPSAPSPFSR